VIVLRDSSNAPLLAWSLSEALPAPRTGGLRFIQLNHGACRATPVVAAATAAAMATSGGLGGGQGGEACRYTFTVDVHGTNPVDIVVSISPRSSGFCRDTYTDAEYKEEEREK
jgi:hypothetical protein